ncbi:MAG: tetratricopeptide repeat protein [Isosphaeraceae bacterium]
MAVLSRSRVTALVLVLAACGVARAGDPDDYTLYVPIIGINPHRHDHTREVVPIRPDLKLWDGRTIVTPRLSTNTYIVERFDRDQRLIRDLGIPARRGWVPAGDIVPLKDAEGYFTATIQAGNRRSFPLLMRGVVRYHFGEYHLALGDLDEALRRAPESVEALLWHASVHSAIHQREQAVADLDRGLQLRPNDAHLLLARAGIIKSTDKKEINRALAYIERAIQSEPSEPYPCFARVSCYLSLDRRDNALKELEDMIRRFPDPESFVATVMFLAKMKEYRVAREVTRARLDQKPDRDLAYKCHIVLALIDASERRQSRAREELAAAISIGPSKEDAYLFRAGLSRSQGDLRHAMVDMDTAIRANPSNGESYEGRAVMHYERQEYAAAIDDMHTAVKLKSEDPEIHERLALMLATCPEASIRRGPEAVAQATRACELSRWKSPTALDTLAAAEAEAGHFLAAAGHEEKAIALLPDNDKRETGYRRSLARYRDHKPAYRLSLLEEWGIRKSRRD